MYDECHILKRVHKIKVCLICRNQLGQHTLQYIILLISTKSYQSSMTIGHSFKTILGSIDTKIYIFIYILLYYLLSLRSTFLFIYKDQHQYLALNTNYNEKWSWIRHFVILFVLFECQCQPSIVFVLVY